MMIPARWLTLREAAELSGLGSHLYWRDVEEARGTTKYSQRTFRKFPRARKLGGKWMVFGSQLARHINNLR